MTSNAAVIAGAKGEGGQVAEGMRADLITVQGNPLETCTCSWTSATLRRSSSPAPSSTSAKWTTRYAKPPRADDRLHLTYERVYGEGAPGDGAVRLPDKEEGQDLLSSMGAADLIPEWSPTHAHE
jgi:hypothetical protein